MAHKRGGLAYRMRDTKSSSERLGPCGICGKYAATVYYLARMQQYTRADGSEGVMELGGHFGHHDCLALQTTYREEHNYE